MHFVEMYTLFLYTLLYILYIVDYSCCLQYVLYYLFVYSIQILIYY